MGEEANLQDFLAFQRSVDVERLRGLGATVFSEHSGQNVPPGIMKVVDFCRKASDDGHEWGWVDTVSFIAAAVKTLFLHVTNGSLAEATYQRYALTGRILSNSRRLSTQCTVGIRVQICATYTCRTAITSHPGS